MKYIVVSEKNGRGSYKMFDNEAEARKFLNTEEYDFCERTLYTDFDEFVNDWCYADENNGTWDERLEQYTELFDRTDWVGDNKMKYLVVDNQLEYGATEEIKEFEILEDAMEYAEHSWNCMSDNDKKHTTAYYVLESANPDEESDNHYDGDIIKRWK